MPNLKIFHWGACPQTPLACSHLSARNGCTSLKWLAPAPWRFAVTFSSPVSRLQDTGMFSPTEIHKGRYTVPGCPSSSFWLFTVSDQKLKEGKAWKQVSLQMNSDTCALLHMYCTSYVLYKLGLSCMQWPELCLLCAFSSHCEASCIVISEEGEDRSPGNEGEEFKAEVTSLSEAHHFCYGYFIAFIWLHVDHNILTVVYTIYTWLYK